MINKYNNNVFYEKIAEDKFKLCIKYIQHLKTSRYRIIFTIYILSFAHNLFAETFFRSIHVIFKFLFTRNKTPNTYVVWKESERARHKSE